MRPVLPLHARQVARHCDCCFVVHPLQKALHGSLRAARAVPIPSGLRTAPAKTAPSRAATRGAVRLGQRLGEFIEQMVHDRSLSSARKVVVTVAGVSVFFNSIVIAFAGTRSQANRGGHTMPHAPQLLLSQFSRRRCSTFPCISRQYRTALIRHRRCRRLRSCRDRSPGRCRCRCSGWCPRRSRRRTCRRRTRRIRWEEVRRTPSRSFRSWRRRWRDRRNDRRNRSSRGRGSYFRRPRSSGRATGRCTPRRKRRSGSRRISRRIRRCGRCCRCTPGRPPGIAPAASSCAICRRRYTGLCVGPAVTKPSGLRTAAAKTAPRGAATRGEVQTRPATWRIQRGCP